MSVIEVLDPEFARSLIEQTALYLSSMRYLSSFIIFDDTSRLITRVGYIDDGYVRIRDAQDTSISLVEILRHMTWTSLSLAQLGATTAQPGESPPPSIVAVGGFDGSYIRMLRTDSDGRLQVGVASLPVTKGDWLSAIPNPPNLDVALSTRASESTLVAVRDRLPISLTTSGNFKVAILEDGVGFAKSSDLANMANLDVALSHLWKLLRWGRNVSPFWVHGAEVTAPAANTALVSKTVSTGKVGYIYGFFISAGEANDFKINWTSGGAAYSLRIVFPGKGSLQYIDFTPLNEGLPADAGTSITITNVNAGSTGVAYQARILYVEV